VDHGGSPDNISIQHFNSVGFTLLCPDQLCLVEPYAPACLTLVNSHWLAVMRYDFDLMYFGSIVGANHSSILARAYASRKTRVSPVTVDILGTAVRLFGEFPGAIVLSPVLVTTRYIELEMPMLLAERRRSAAVARVENLTAYRGTIR
jgi:hypothetical protein